MDSGHFDSGCARVSEGNTVMMAADLYDLACICRVSGVVDRQLCEFTNSFKEPKSSATTPREPSESEVNDYTVWLAVRGIENSFAIASIPNQPLTLAEAVELYTVLLRNFIVYSHEEAVNILDSLQDFFALMLRYPVLPLLAVDSKECPECYFESDITLDTWQDVKRTISCYHFTLRHEYVPVKYSVNLEARSLLRFEDENRGMVRLDPHSSVFASETESDAVSHDRPRPVRFLEQLESLKRRDEIIKQKTLGKEIYHRLKSHTRALDELEAPRYLSPYPLVCLYRYYGSLNRSRERATSLLDRSRQLDVDVARLKVDDLKLNLRSIASTGTNDQLLSYMCTAMIGPARRYNLRYSCTAERIVLFKHLISSGFSIETADSLVKTILVSNRVSMLEVPLDKGVELQLKKTTQPTTYNRKVASLVWLFSHITAYCTLRQLEHGHVLMGDSPEELEHDGIYVFDQEHVGFRLSRPNQLELNGRSSPWVSAYMPFARVLELLALRDYFEERVC